MSLKISNHLFTGPFDFETAKVRTNQDPAVFAIVCRAGKPWNPEFSLIAVDKSGPEGVTFKDHPGRPKWESQCDGETGVYFLQFSKAQMKEADPRDAVVAEIREALNPPGGIIPITGM